MVGILDRIAAIQGPSIGESFVSGQNTALNRALTLEQNARANQRSVLEALDFQQRQQAARDAAARAGQVDEGVRDVLEGNAPPIALATLGPEGREAAQNVTGLLAPPPDTTPAALRIFREFQQMTPEQQQQFTEFQQSRTPSTTVNVRPSKGADALSKARGEQVAGVLEQGNQAVQRLPGLFQLRDITRSLPTGFGQQGRVNLLRGLAAVGITNTGALQNITDAQRFQSGVNTLLLETLRQQKGPQTEGDAQRALRTLPSIANEREANEFIVDNLIALDQRRIDIANFSEAYLAQNPDDFAGLRKATTEFVRDTPTFRTERDGSYTYFHEWREAAAAQNPQYSPEEILKAWQDSAR